MSKVLVEKTKDLVSHILHDVNRLPHGTHVVVGGRITSVFEVPVEPESAYITLDDDIASCNVYVPPNAYEAFKNSFVVDNEILVKGRVLLMSRNKLGEDRHIVCSSIAQLPKGGKNARRRAKKV